MKHLDNGACRSTLPQATLFSIQAPLATTSRAIVLPLSFLLSPSSALLPLLSSALLCFSTPSLLELHSALVAARSDCNNSHCACDAQQQHYSRKLPQPFECTLHEHFFVREVGRAIIIINEVFAAIECPTLNSTKKDSTGRKASIQSYLEPCAPFRQE